MKILITGGTSFIGRNLAARLGDLDHRVVTLSRSTKNEIRHDLRAPLSESLIERIGDVDYIVHAAAEVSGARSVQDPVLAVNTGVLGTLHVLEAARRIKPKKILYLSTGEVVGQVDHPGFAGEYAPLRPSNPYAAAKAAGEELSRVYSSCFGVPVVIARLMNVFGPGQTRPRFIPMVSERILRHRTVEYHVEFVDGAAMSPGSRNWMGIGDCVNWLMYLIFSGIHGGTYHVVGPEIDNSRVIGAIVEGLGLQGCVSRAVSPPDSHDLRYALRDTKLGICLDRNTVLQQIANTSRYFKENQWHAS